MKKLLFISLILFGCHKTTTQPQTQSQPSTTQTLHTLTYKCYCSTTNGMKVQYELTDANGNPSQAVGRDSTGLNFKTYSITVKQNYTTIMYFLNIIPTIGQDSVRAEIWLDGVFKTSARDQMVVYDYFYY